MVAVVAGYVLQRVIEGLFIKDFGMDIHVWQKFDSDFRLVTARRNPNFAILFFATLGGSPDIGLIAVAWWTIISLIVHAVRLRSEEHTSELQSLMRISYAVFCLKKTNYKQSL